MGGSCGSGMTKSMMLVVPPARPAAVPVKKSSAVTVAMNGRCLWGGGGGGGGGGRIGAQRHDAAIDAQQIGSLFPVGVDHGAAANHKGLVHGEISFRGVDRTGVAFSLRSGSSTRPPRPG